MANIPTLLATNTLEGATLFAPRLTRLFKGAKGSKLGTAAEIAGRATLNSLQEQTEEALQQGIQDWAMGRDYGVLPWKWTDAQWEAASRVKYPAALIGGAGGIYHSVLKPNDTTPNPEAVPPKGNADTNATTDSTQSNPAPDTENTIDVEAEVLPTQQQETTTPIDINAEDDATQKLFEQFAEERRRSSQDATEVDFFDGMFTDKDKFINSKENRNAIRQNYGIEMTAWANSLQQEQKLAQKSQQNDEYLNNAPVIESGRKFLEQLRAQGKNAEFSLRLQSAIQSGNTSEVENILKQHSVAIPSQQTPRPKRTTSTDLEPKILEIIPSDKFITDDEILMQVDDVEPWELPDIMLSLQLKGQVEESAGRYKRNKTLQNEEQTLQEERVAPWQNTQPETEIDAFDLLPDVDELNDVEPQPISHRLINERSNEGEKLRANTEEKLNKILDLISIFCLAVILMTVFLYMKLRRLVDGYSYKVKEYGQEYVE